VAHLEDLTIIQLLRGEDDPEAQRHLDGCRRCLETLRFWRHIVDGLRQIDKESIDDAELHRLAVLYRQLGPGKGALPSWEARPVRPGSLATAAVRGAGELVELAAGPCTVVLQVETERASVTSIHGQLVCEEKGIADGGRVVFLSDGGDGYVADVDSFGEFHLDRLPVGRYRAAWYVSGGLVTLQSIQVGHRGDN